MQIKEVRQLKKIKGFTLIELIIVMAILSILMVGIMQMMKPIRATFVDSTYYEAQRTTQNGIVEYITETLRYADNIGIYTKGQSDSGKTVNNVIDAVTFFKAAVKNDDGSELSDSQINIITIDNTVAYKYGGVDCYGRIVRSKSMASGSYNATAEKAGSGCQGRLALGEAYYGDCNYSINVVPDGKNIKLSVASIIATSLKAESSARNVKTESITDSSNKFVLTEGYVVCQNLDISGNQFKTEFAGTTTTTQGKNTYIVFTLPKN